MPSPTPHPRPVSARAARTAAIRLLNALADQESADPLVALWREWSRTAAAVKRSCRTAQKLERHLFATIGPPRIVVPLDPPSPQPVYAVDGHTIDRLLGTTAETHPKRTRLKRELKTVVARWEREADACGLTAARADEAAAARRMDDLLKTAAATPAQSLAGVVAKLVIVTDWGRWEPETASQPWPFLHGALMDVIMLTNKSGINPHIS